MPTTICSHLHIISLALHATNNTGPFCSHSLRDLADHSFFSASPPGYDFPLYHLDQETPDHDLSNPGTVARLLLAENIKSVCHHHKEDPARYYFHELTFDITPAYRDRFLHIKLAPVQLLKLIRCLASESSDHAAWIDSLSKKILDTLTQDLLPKFPGYEQAPWAIDDDYQPSLAP